MAERSRNRRRTLWAVGLAAAGLIAASSAAWAWRWHAPVVAVADINDMGDLINLQVNERGFGFLRARTTRVTLSRGPLSLFDADGSAFIVHVNPDTYCPGGEVAGCAGGARAACGIIRLTR